MYRYYSFLIVALIIISLICCKENPVNKQEIIITTTDSCPHGNNEINCADEIQLGIVKKEKIETINDTDFFKFKINQAGVIEIAVENVPSNLIMDMRLYGSGQTEIAWATGNTYGSPVYQTYLGEPGQYYIRCKAINEDLDSINQYSLKVTLDTSDIYEINNDISKSKTIQLGKTIKGKIRPFYDIDFFTFVINTQGVLEIAVDTVPSDIKMQVILYNSQQNIIENIVDSLYGHPIHSFTLQEKGNYYLQLNGESQSSNQFYAFRINLDSSDIYEINNSFSQAAEISLNTNIQGKIFPDCDIDIFKFTASTSGTYHIIVDPVPTELSINLYVYNSQFVYINYSNNTTNGQPIYLDVDLTPGIYYLNLSERYCISSSQFYTLRINK